MNNIHYQKFDFGFSGNRVEKKTEEEEKQKEEALKKEEESKKSQIVPPKAKAVTAKADELVENYIKAYMIPKGGNKSVNGGVIQKEPKETTVAGGSLPKPTQAAEPQEPVVTFHDNKVTESETEEGKPQLQLFQNNTNIGLSATVVPGVPTPTPTPNAVQNDQQSAQAHVLPDVGNEPGEGNEVNNGGGAQASGSVQNNVNQGTAVGGSAAVGNESGLEDVQQLIAQWESLPDDATFEEKINLLGQIIDIYENQLDDIDSARIWRVRRFVVCDKNKGLQCLEYMQRLQAGEPYDPQNWPEVCSNTSDYDALQYLVVNYDSLDADQKLACVEAYIVIHTNDTLTNIVWGVYGGSTGKLGIAHDDAALSFGCIVMAANNPLNAGADWQGKFAEYQTAFAEFQSMIDSPDHGSTIEVQGKISELTTLIEDLRGQGFPYCDELMIATQGYLVYAGHDVIDLSLQPFQQQVVYEQVTSILGQYTNLSPENLAELEEFLMQTSIEYVQEKPWYNNYEVLTQHLSHYLENVVPNKIQEMGVLSDNYVQIINEELESFWAEYNELYSLTDEQRAELEILLRTNAEDYIKGHTNYNDDTLHSRLHNNMRVWANNWINENELITIEQTLMIDNNIYSCLDSCYLEYNGALLNSEQRARLEELVRSSAIHYLRSHPNATQDELNSHMRWKAWDIIENNWGQLLTNMEPSPDVHNDWIEDKFLDRRQGCNAAAMGDLLDVLLANDPENGYWPTWGLPDYIRGHLHSIGWDSNQMAQLDSAMEQAINAVQNGHWQNGAYYVGNYNMGITRTSMFGTITLSDSAQFFRSFMFILNRYLGA